MLRRRHLRKAKKYIFEFFTNNVILKLMAFVISVGLWLIVSTSYDVDVVKRVPINYISSAETSVSSDALRDVEVRLVGTRSFMHEVLKRSYVINVDLRDRKVGAFSYRLHKDLLKLPAGARITGFYPSEISARIERSVTKTLKVMPSFAGEIPHGYHIRTVNIEPAKVEVTGPESFLENMEGIYTEPINLNHLYESTTRNVVLERIYRENMSSVSHDTFSMLIEVVPRMLSKTFGDIDVVVLGARSYSMDTDKVQVTIKGPQLIMENIGAGNISAVLDLSFNKPGEHEEKVSVRLPRQVELVSVRPSKIKVKIKENTD